MIAKYLGKTDKYLQHNHNYLIDITKPKKSYVYDIYISKDLTDNLDMDMVRNYASQISIKQYFELSEEINIEGE